MEFRLEMVLPDRAARPQVKLPETELHERLREREAILVMAEQSAGIGIWEIDLAHQTVRGTPQFWRVMAPAADRPGHADRKLPPSAIAGRSGQGSTRF